MGNGLTRHHKFYPSTDYKEGFEQFFRNIPCNIELLSRREHDVADFKPKKPKPSMAMMVIAVDKFLAGICGCDHHLPKQYYYPALHGKKKGAKHRKAKC